jgi:hypothetical protein
MTFKVVVTRTALHEMTKTIVGDWVYEIVGNDSMGVVYPKAAEAGLNGIEQLHTDKLKPITPGYVRLLALSSGTHGGISGCYHRTERQFDSLICASFSCSGQPTLSAVHVLVRTLLERSPSTRSRRFFPFQSAVIDVGAFAVITPVNERPLRHEALFWI